MKALFIAGLLLWPGMLTANPIGTWATEPDDKGQIAHVEARHCGSTVCGKIVRAYDRNGQQITTPNVGKALFWDMSQVSAGEYIGTGWLPLRDKTFKARMKVDGDRMLVKGCIGPVCSSQSWHRVTGAR